MITKTTLEFRIQNKIFPNCSLSAIVANALVEVLGTRIVVFIGSVLVSLGLVLSSLASNLGWFYLSFCSITGLGGALCYSPALIMVTLYFKDRIGLANGISVAGGGIGAMLLPLLIRLFLTSYSLRGCLLIMGGSMLNLCVMALLFRPIPRPPSSQGVPESKSSCGRRLALVLRKTSSDLGDFSLLKNPLLIVHVLATCVSNMAYNNVFFILPNHAETSGIDADRAASLIALIGIGDLVGRVGFGYVMDLPPFKHRKVWGYKTSILLTGIAVLTSPVMTSYPPLAAFSVVFGLVSGSCVAMVAVVYRETFGEHQRKALSLTFTATSVFIILSTTIAGALRDQTGNWIISLVFAGLSSLCSWGILMLEPVAARYVARQSIDAKLHRSGMLAT